MEEKKHLKNYLVGRYTWRIENFSNLKESMVYSDTFVGNEHRWRLLIYPKGNKVLYLSVFLEVPDSASFPDGWSRTAEYSIALINQIDSKKTIKRETERKFTKEDGSWGFPSFIPLSELHDKSRGYLVNDTCLIQAEVSEPDALLVFEDKHLYSSVHDDPVESIYIKAESFLKSVPKKSSSQVSDAICEVDDHVNFAKECFKSLISNPSTDLAETETIETLSILGDGLSLFSNEQAKEIVNLKATFDPKIIQDWRESIEIKVRNHRLLSTFEKTNHLLEDLVKYGKGIKIKLEELNEREKGLVAQLEVLRSKSRQLKEERKQVSKQTKQVYAIAEEQYRKIEDERPEVEVSNKKLEDIERKWRSIKA